MDNHNITDFAGWHKHKPNVSPDEKQGVSYEMFIMPLIKAVQELSAQITTLQNEVNTLKGE